MARITIDRFGGVLPSRLNRDLPPGNGQKAENLDLRYGDFRSVKGTGSSVASVTSGTVSVHRTPSGTWLESTSDADFVNGQVNDPATERVYVTGKAAYPQVWESGTYYRLGVRTPTAAPTVSVVTVDEYTKEDRETSVRTWMEDIKASVLANITSSLLGNGTPVTGALGAIWLTHGDNVDMPTYDAKQICYCTPITGGVADNASDAYLLDPLLGGKQITEAGQDYWAVPMTWRVWGYDLDEAALSTELQTFTKPPDNLVALVSATTADQIAARVGAIADPTKDPLLTLVTRLNTAQGDVATFVTREITDAARAYALADYIQRLHSAVRAIEAYFNTWEQPLGTILNDYAYVVPDYVDRVVETRAYRFTYVNAWGEESAPSPVSELLELDQNDTVDVTIASPPATGAYVAHSYWRLYRSSTTNDGAEYQFVAEIAIGTLTYNDSLRQEELQELLPSTTWTEPRSDMLNLCGGSNGIMLGSAGKVLCACEPFQPFAWPREYELSFEHEIVAVKSVGQSWIVLTEGDAHVVSGADPASLSSQKLPRAQACSAKRSAVGVEGGALFVSPDGICLADGSGVSLLTGGAYTREDWQALTPANSLGAFHEGVYHLWLSTAGKRISLYMDKGELSVTTVTAPGAAYTDLLTDTLYTVSGTSVLPNFSGSTQTGVFKTGIIHTNGLPSFGWLQVQGEHTSVTVKIYAEGSLVHTATVTNNTPQRLPAVRARYWEIQVESTSRFSRLVMASSRLELRGA